jgi:hypothetical protein
VIGISITKRLINVVIVHPEDSTPLIKKARLRTNPWADLIQLSSSKSISLMLASHVVLSLPNWHFQKFPWKILYVFWTSSPVHHTISDFSKLVITMRPV